MSQGGKPGVGWLAKLLRYRQLPLELTARLDRLQMMLRWGRRYPLADKNGQLSCAPLFIISAGRSGTTLLRSMLVAGGDIAIPLESQFIPVATRRFLAHQRLGWPDLSRLVISQFVSHHHFHLWETNPVALMQSVPNLPSEERSLARLIDLLFLAYQEQNFPDALMWGEQSPINALYLPWIVQTFPTAKFLHMIRDGRDVAASMIRSNAGASNLEEAARRWLFSVKQARKLATQLPPDQFLEIRYEDLVRDSSVKMRQICQFCGIEYQQIMLDYWQLPTTVEHRLFAHHKNLGRPLFTDSIGRWRERLSAEEAEYVTERLGPVLAEYGYGSERE